MSTEQNLRLVDDYIKAINDRDWDRSKGYLSEDTRWHGPGSEEHYRGNEVITSSWISYLMAFPDSKLEKRQSFGQGTWVCFEGTEFSTHKGQLILPEKAIPPTGMRLVLPFCMLFKIEKEKIVEIREYMNQLDMMAKLGLQSQ